MIQETLGGRQRRGGFGINARAKDELMAMCDCKTYSHAHAYHQNINYRITGGLKL